MYKNLGFRKRHYQSAFVQAQGSINAMNYAAGLLVFAYNLENNIVTDSIRGGNLNYNTIKKRAS